MSAKDSELITQTALANDDQHEAMKDQAHHVELLEPTKDAPKTLQES